jgi:hypothetical protein
VELSRRDILTSIAAAGATQVAARPSAASVAQRAADPFGVLVDLTACIGCRKCEWACNQVNHLPAVPVQAFEDASVFASLRRTDASHYTVVNGTQGQAYPVLTTGDGLGAGQSAYLAGLTENAAYRCNIGVVNTGTENATVLVELFDGAGRNLGSYTVSLGAGQWVQPTQPFLNVAGQTAMDRGYAKITVQSGSGVFAFASVIDNITNDPTPVTMQR